MTPANRYVLAVILSVFLFSCNKNEEIGYNVQPNENLLEVAFENSIAITAHTVLEDSVRTDETLINLVGSISDPVFGTTTAGMYTQFRLTTNNVNFGTGAICDSVALSFAYKGIYGDSNSTHVLNVYEIDEFFDIENPYYSHQRLGVFKKDLANYSFIPNFEDSVKVGSSMLAPHLRLFINKSIGQKIIDAGASNLQDNASFLKFFKGLYITTKKVNSNGSILYINPTSTLSKLTIYYHNSEDTLTYNLVLNENCARFTTFEHYKYSGASSQFKQQINGDTLLGNNTLYIQGMSGSKVRLKFPEALLLNNLGKIAINRAELVVNVNADAIGDYPPPDILTLVLINNDETLSFLPDVAYGESYFGGTYNSDKKEYRFNISKYLQNALMNGNFNDKGLYLVISGAAVRANRAVLNGNKTSEDNLRLEVVYTKIK